MTTYAITAYADYVELHFEVEIPSGHTEKACITVYKRSDDTMEISPSGRLRQLSIAGTVALIDMLKQAHDIAIEMRDNTQS